MNEQISEFLKRRWVVPTSVGLAAFSGGGVLGYILGKRKERKESAFQINRVLGSMQDGDLQGYSIAFNPDSDVEEVRIVSEVTLDTATLLPHEQVVFDVPAVTIVREPHDEIEWDWEAEKSTRTAEEPYILHRDEFFEDSMGYTQSTVTYYEGDDILTDELDVPIYGHTAMVGELRFGHGSGDSDVVYIRSELLEHEYEVILNHGRYEVEILGHEIDEQYKDQDLKHSNVPKFRME